MDPDTKINSTDEISDIVQQILAKLDEPDLEGKIIEFNIMQPEALEDYLITERGATRNTAAIVDGHTLREGGKYKVRIRSMDIYTLLTTYFHELGHIATIDKVMARDREQAYTITETLAYLFQGYAQEKFNELDYGWKYYETMRETRKLFFDEALKINDITPYRRKSLQMISDMLKMEDATFEELYKSFKKLMIK